MLLLGSFQDLRNYFWDNWFDDASSPTNTKSWIKDTNIISFSLRNNTNKNTKEEQINIKNSCRIIGATILNILMKY